MQTNASNLHQEYVTAPQAAVYLNVSRNTVYHWLKQGFIPHHRFGRLVRIRFADLKAFEERTRA
jgi:excisionase family DNA binding protein